MRMSIDTAGHNIEAACVDDCVRIMKVLGHCGNAAIADRLKLGLCKYRHEPV